MTQTPKDLGAHGEEVAANHLKKHGYNILEKNYRCHFGEIDIVAEMNGKLIFVEVKTGSKNLSFSALDHFDFRKQKKVLQLAHYYLSLQAHPRDARIDLLVIEKTGQDFYVDHFEDVIQDEET